MTDHVPAPAAYEGEWPESPMTEPDRHQLRMAIRQLQRGRLDQCELEIERHPAITSLTVSYAAVDGGFALDLDIREDAFDCDLIANERCDPGGVVTLNDDPHFLRDLGQCWYHLEADLITQFSTLLDLPPAMDDLTLYTVTPIGIRCTTVQTGFLACFATLFFAREANAD